MRKKILIICLMILTVISLTGCAKKNTTKTTEDENLSGGFTSDTSASSLEIEEDDKTVFDEAIKKYDDSSLEVFSLLATQEDEGTNYLFLAKSTKKKVTKWALVLINKSKKDKVTLTSVNDFNYSEYANTNSSVDEAEEHGWKVISDLKGTLDDELNEKFNKAVEETYAGYELVPVTLLGTQVVAGTNYAILTHISSEEDNINNLAVVTLYEDLKGNVEISGVGEIDLSNIK